MSDKYKFSPLSQDDFTEELWDEFQNIAWSDTVNILEDCTAKVAKAIKAAQREHIPDGRNLAETRFSWIAMLARLAYLKGFAAGQATPEVNAEKAFAECAKDDDFAEYDFDCEVTPGKATAEFLSILSKLPNMEK